MKWSQLEMKLYTLGIAKYYRVALILSRYGWRSPALVQLYHTFIYYAYYTRFLGLPMLGNVSPASKLMFVKRVAFRRWADVFPFLCYLGYCID